MYYIERPKQTCKRDRAVTNKHKKKNGEEKNNSPIVYYNVYDFYATSARKLTASTDYVVLYHASCDIFKNRKPRLEMHARVRTESQRKRKGPDLDSE